MLSYTVHENENREIRLLPDGRAIMALIFPPLWLAWHRLWWALTVYLALMVAAYLFVWTTLAPAAIFLSTLPGLYLFLEGHELIRRKANRQGWREIGLVSGDDIEEAEQRYFDALGQAAALSPPTAANPSPATTRSRISQPESIGLFAEDDPR